MARQGLTDPANPKAGFDKNSAPWIYFKACSGPSIGKDSFIFEFVSASSREFSRITRTASTGEFLHHIECQLRAEQEHTFILHRLNIESGRFIKIDNINFSVGKRGKSIMHFSLDWYDICEAISRSGFGKISKSISSAEGYNVAFDASLTRSGEEEVEEVEIIHCNLDEEGLGEESHGTLKVRFDEDIHLIPTTKELKEEIQQAVSERAKLSQNVGDLSLQLFHMKHEMRDIKDSLRQVTELFAREARKRDIQERKESRNASPKRRRVVLDGNGIAKEFGEGNFRTEGIEIALEYFFDRDISAVAVVSDNKHKDDAEVEQKRRKSHEKDRLKHLMQRGMVSITPLQTKRGDYILKYALDHEAEVVSNDSFQSIIAMQNTSAERNRLRAFLKTHRIPFAFIGRKFVPNPGGSKLSSTSPSASTIARSDTL